METGNGQRSTLQTPPRRPNFIIAFDRWWENSSWPKFRHGKFKENEMITTQYEDELDLASPAGNQLEQSAPQADAMPPTRAPQILIVSPVSEDHTILGRM